MMFRYWAAIALLALPSTSFAYLDPGTGSMILQGVIAGIALGAFTLKHYWQKFVNFFRRKTIEEDPDTPDSREGQDNGTIH